MQNRTVFKNGGMTLRLIAKKKDSAVFARLNTDGTNHDFIYAWIVHFDGENVWWGQGSYNLTKEQALRKLNA